MARRPWDSLRFRVFLLIVLGLVPTLAVVAVALLEAADTGDGPARLTRNLLALLTVNAAVVAASWGASNALFLGKIHAVVQATRRLSAGDATARTGLPVGRDELSELARAFDDMATVLHQRQAEATQAAAALHQAKEELAQRVAWRTDQVREVNERLQRELVERQRAEAETLAALRRAELLLETSTDLNRGLTSHDVSQTIVDSAARLLAGAGGVLWSARPGGEALRVTATSPGLAELIDAEVPRGQGPVGQALQAREVIVVEDGRDAPPCGAGGPFDHAQAGAYIAAPLRVGDAVLAVLTVHHDAPRPYPPQERAILTAFANQAAIALRNVRLRDELAASLRSLDARTRALEAKTREQEAFVYTVAHDLKSPLFALQGMATLLADHCGAQLDGTGRDYLARLVDSVRTLEGLLNDLLDLARIGRVDATFEPVDLGEVLHEALAHLEPRLSERGADVGFEGRPPTILANRVRMIQLFTNLIDNAVKYTPPERAPVVRVTATDRGDRWEIGVRDNGVGIPEAFHHKVFRIFQRLPNGKALNPAGSGVGLAIVARIAETHSGSCWLESREGVGTTVYVTIAHRVPADVDQEEPALV